MCVCVCLGKGRKSDWCSKHPSPEVEMFAATFGPRKLRVATPDESKLKLGENYSAKLSVQLRLTVFFKHGGLQKNQHDS